MQLLYPNCWSTQFLYSAVKYNSEKITNENWGVKIFMRYVDKYIFFLNFISF